MENSNKASEYKNIIDTWDENEKKRAEEIAANPAGKIRDEEPAGNDLEQLIKQEASEYDNENKENRILSGDRATVNDDANTSDSDK